MTECDNLYKKDNVYFLRQEDLSGSGSPKVVGLAGQLEKSILASDPKPFSNQFRGDVRRVIEDFRRYRGMLRGSSVDDAQNQVAVGNKMNELFYLCANCREYNLAEEVNEASSGAVLVEMEDRVA